MNHNLLLLVNHASPAPFNAHILCSYNNCFDLLYIISVACWRVGELCGPVAHASPTHPGAAACGCFGPFPCSECPNSFVDSVFSEEACEVSPCIVCKKPKVFSRHDVSEAAHVNAKSPLFAVQFTIPRPVAILSQYCTRYIVNGKPLLCQGAVIIVNGTPLVHRYLCNAVVLLFSP